MEFISKTKNKHARTGKICVCYRFKPHDPPVVFFPRQFFWISVLKPYSPGGTLYALALYRKIYSILVYRCHSVEYAGIKSAFIPTLLLLSVSNSPDGRLRNWHSSVVQCILLLITKLYQPTLYSSLYLQKLS